MYEKSDLDKMLIEVRQDEEFEKTQSGSRVSQEDIKRILLEKKKKAQREE